MSKFSTICEAWNKNYKNLLENAQLNNTVAGAVGGGLLGSGIGGIGGTVGGAVGGAKLINKLTGKKERIAIKRIILQSDTPQQCIANLKRLGTTKALKYCAIVAKVSRENPYGWKQSLATKINIKNVGGTLTGGVTGGLVGGYVGSNVGGLLGSVGGGAIGYGLS